MDIQPEQHSRISTRINLFEEIFNTLKNGYSNENLRYAFSMFHFYLGTLRYVQQYRNAGTNEAEDEGIVNVAIHYMKENMEKHLSLEEISNTNRIFSVALLHVVQKANGTQSAYLL